MWRCHTSARTQTLSRPYTAHPQEPEEPLKPGSSRNGGGVLLHSKTVSLEGGALSVQLLGRVHKYREYLKCQRLGADAKNTKIRVETSQVSLPAPPSRAPSDDGPRVGAEAGSDPDDDSERRQPPLNSSWGPAPPPAPPPPADDAAPPPAPPPPAGAVVAPPPLLSHIAVKARVTPAPSLS